MENPVAFAAGATRALSLAHLHAQYAWLLVAPVRMSADWSYRCVRLVTGLGDPRNLGSAITYVWLAWAALSGRPWRVAAAALYGQPKARALRVFRVLRRLK